MSQLHLLEQAADPAPKRPRHASRDAWLERIRPAITAEYSGRVITTDHVWLLMTSDPDLMIPRTVHHNSMALVFRGWKGARRSPGFRRSRRGRAKSNPLRAWRIL